MIGDSILTYKIPCVGKESPLKIWFKPVHLQGFFNDLQVFISQEDHVPTQQKCEISATAPHVLTVYAYEKKEYFTGFNIYISFYSESGMAVLVNPVFSTVIADRQARFRKRQKMGAGSKLDPVETPLSLSASPMREFPEPD